MSVLAIVAEKRWLVTYKRSPLSFSWCVAVTRDAAKQDNDKENKDTFTHIYDVEYEVIICIITFLVSASIT